MVTIDGVNTYANSYLEVLNNVLHIFVSELTAYKVKVWLSVLNYYGQCI